MSESARRPVIAITSDYAPEKDWHFTTNAYMNAVRGAGAVPIMTGPVIRTPQDYSGCREEWLEKVDIEPEILDGVDGVLFSGGCDVDPALYGEPCYKRNGYITPWRDIWEIALLKECMRRKMPVFGICRGIQLMAAALGAKLRQDVYTADRYTPEDFDSTKVLQHRQEAPNWYGIHSVSTKQGSRLSQILGPQAWVNSFHHQCVAPGTWPYEITAMAPDGTIEGIEIADYPYFVAVQWHPERMQNDPKMRRLFSCFADACRMYHTEKKG